MKPPIEPSLHIVIAPELEYLVHVTYVIGVLFLVTAPKCNGLTSRVTYTTRALSKRPIDFLHTPLALLGYNCLLPSALRLEGYYIARHRCIKFNRMTTLD